MHIHDLIDSLWDFDDPAGSAARFRAAASEPGRPAGHRGVLLTQLARAEGLAGDFDRAAATLAEAEHLTARAGGAAAELRVRVLVERGRVLNSSGRPADAAMLFEQAFDAARGSDLDALAVDAAHMVAIAAPARAVEWNTRGMELADRSADPRARRWRGSLANNMGWTLHDAGRFGEALAMFTRSLDHRRESGSPRQVAIAEWSIARCLRSMGEITRAIDIQRSLADRAEPTGDHRAFIEEELAECHRALGNHTAAEAHASLARAARAATS